MSPFVIITRCFISNGDGVNNGALYASWLNSRAQRANGCIINVLKQQPPLIPSHPRTPTTHTHPPPSPHPYLIIGKKYFFQAAARRDASAAPRSTLMLQIASDRSNFGLFSLSLSLSHERTYTHRQTHTHTQMQLGVLN